MGKEKLNKVCKVGRDRMWGRESQPVLFSEYDNSFGNFLLLNDLKCLNVQICKTC